MATGRSSTLQYLVEAKAGRLIEARIFGLRTLAEVEAYSGALAAQVDKMINGPPPVLCADHRPVVIYSQLVANRLAELFAAMNTRLGLVTIIAARSNATLVLQLERLVREANYAQRRVVYTPIDAERSLASVLDEVELKRARAFLAEYAPPP